jgi:hypothetical protein
VPIGAALPKKINVHCWTRARYAGLPQQQRAFKQYAVDMRRLRQSIEKAFHRIKLKHLIERDALCLRLIAKPSEN